MNVTLLYFDGCPNWQQAEARVLEALHIVGLPKSTLVLEQVTTEEEAEQRRFRGSPTVLIDGRDPFADEDAPTGLSCRLYTTPEGPSGTPTVDQLVAALS